MGHRKARPCFVHTQKSEEPEEAQFQTSGLKPQTSVEASAAGAEAGGPQEENRGEEEVAWGSAISLALDRP